MSIWSLATQMIPTNFSLEHRISARAPRGTSEAHVHVEIYAHACTHVQEHPHHKKEGGSCGEDRWPDRKVAAGSHVNFGGAHNLFF